MDLLAFAFAFALAMTEDVNQIPWIGAQDWRPRLPRQSRCTEGSHTENRRSSQMVRIDSPVLI